MYTGNRESSLLTFYLIAVSFSSDVVNIRYSDMYIYIAGEIDYSSIFHLCTDYYLVLFVFTVLT
jgi:hypothetical protein